MLLRGNLNTSSISCREHEQPSAGPLDATKQGKLTTLYNYSSWSCRWIYSFTAIKI